MFMKIIHRGFKSRIKKNKCLATGPAFVLRTLFLPRIYLKSLCSVKMAGGTGCNLVSLRRGFIFIHKTRPGWKTWLKSVGVSAGRAIEYGIGEGNTGLIFVGKGWILIFGTCTDSDLFIDFNNTRVTLGTWLVLDYYKHGWIFYIN